MGMRKPSLLILFADEWELRAYDVDFAKTFRILLPHVIKAPASGNRLEAASLSADMNEVVCLKFLAKVVIDRPAATTAEDNGKAKRRP